MAIVDYARTLTTGTTSKALQAWLASAHGEAHAACKDAAASYSAFDDARSLLDAGRDTAAPEFVTLTPVHLERWRGHAMATLGDAGAVELLGTLVNGLDSTFVRARSAAYTDLALAYFQIGAKAEAEKVIGEAASLAASVGSARQSRRIHTIRRALGGGLKEALDRA